MVKLWDSLYVIPDTLAFRVMFNTSFFMQPISMFLPKNRIWVTRRGWRESITCVPNILSHCLGTRWCKGEWLANPTQQIFWLLLMDEKLQSLGGNRLKKLVFLFGDNIMLDDDFSTGGVKRWLYEAKGERFFLPPISWLSSLVYLQHLLVSRCSVWELVRSFPAVTVSQLEGVDTPFCTEKVLGLFPGYVQDGYPQGEVPCLAKVFGGQYLKSEGDYPSRCREDGWVSSLGDKCWSQMVTHASPRFHAFLSRQDWLLLCSL